MRALTTKAALLSTLLLGSLASLQAATVFIERNGRVVIEAEHFDSRAAEVGGDNHRYVVVPDENAGVNGPFVNARAGKFVQNIPDAGQNRNAPEVVGTAPYVEYKVQITTTGEYQLFLRTVGWDGGADSVYAQITEIKSPAWYRFSPDPTTRNFSAVYNNNADATTISGWNGYGAPEAVSGDGSEEPALFSIPAAGTYSIRISQREDGNAIDAIILQRSNLPPPTGIGPAESRTVGDVIPIVAPKITAQPNDVRLEPGGKATFTVQADVVPETIKWFKNGVEIAGATDLTYTTPNVTAADNNAKFKVALGNSAGTVESREAVLSVVAAGSVLTRGFLKADLFLGIPNTSLDELKNAASFTADKPDETVIIPLFEYPPGTPTTPPAADVRNNYGVRISGFIMPQETASYIFYLASDDNGELYLSTDDKPANKQLIATEPQWNPVRNWTAETRRPGCPDACENVSAPIRLEAGKSYYVEALMKEGGGGDNLAVTWIKQGDPKPVDTVTPPLHGGVIAVNTNPNLASDLKITEQPKPATVIAPAKATFTVKAEANPPAPIVYQWQKDGKDIPGATGPTYTTDFTKATDSGKIRVVVAVPGRTVNSDEVNLTVNADTAPPTIARVSGSASFDSVTVTFSEPLDPATAGNRANYSLSGGLTISSATFVAPLTVKLATSKQNVDTSYTLTVSNVKDPAGNVIAAPNNTFTFQSFVFQQGLAKWEVYTGIPGNSVQDLVNNAKYPDRPDVVMFRPAFEGITGYAETFGSRLSAWVTPQQTGNYVFFMSTDDNGALFLSTDENPANKKQIAAETAWSDARRWVSSGGNSDLTAKRSDQYASTEWPGGNTIRLEAGKRYYLELLQKEGTGGDNQSATMIVAGSPDPADQSPALSGNLIGIYVDPNQGKPAIVDQPKSVTIASGGSATFSLKVYGSPPLRYQWNFRGTAIPGATNATLTISNAQKANAGDYTVVITNDEGSVTSAPANLVLTDIPSALFAVGNLSLNASDALVKARLEAMGLQVITMLAASTTTADATGKVLIVTSSTVASGDIGNKFQTVAVPIVNWENALQDNYLFTLDQDGVTRGAATGQTQINIVNANHPLAAGLPAGTRTVSSAVDYSWGTPGTDAIVIASVVGEPTRALIYAYEKGSKLIDGSTAAARRVHFMMTDNTAAALNADGLKLLDAALQWAANVTVTPTGPKLTIARSGANLTIQWDGGGTLESADNITGPWAAVANATSPATVAISGARKFYRVRR